MEAFPEPRVRARWLKGTPAAAPDSGQRMLSAGSGASSLQTPLRGAGKTPRAADLPSAAPTSRTPMRAPRHQTYIVAAIVEGRG